MIVIFVKAKISYEFNKSATGSVAVSADEIFPARFLPEYVIVTVRNIDIKMPRNIFGRYFETFGGLIK